MQAVESVLFVFSTRSLVFNCLYYKNAPPIEQTNIHAKPGKQTSIVTKGVAIAGRRFNFNCAIEDDNSRRPILPIKIL